MADHEGIKDAAIRGMKEYFRNERYINHTLKVLDQAERIMQGEKIGWDFLKSVITLSCIYHDIGIPEAVKKYSSSDAPYQEKEGPPLARELMNGIGVRRDVLERVCFIVGAHHTKGEVDGIDFQIVWESDFIVNLDEKNIVLKQGELRTALEENTVTGTGRSLASELLNRLYPSG
jgi:hypothetical protein